MKKNCKLKKIASEQMRFSTLKSDYMVLPFYTHGTIIRAGNFTIMEL